MLVTASWLETSTNADCGLGKLQKNLIFAGFKPEVSGVQCCTPRPQFLLTTTSWSRREYRVFNQYEMCCVDLRQLLLLLYYIDLFITETVCIVLGADVQF
jgi:hypothetical protein